MAKSIAERMFIKAGYRIAVPNGPGGFLENIGTLPENVSFETDLSADKAYDIACVFIETHSELEDQLPNLVKSIKPDGYIWISYPKKSSKMKSDLSRDSIWAYGKENGLKSVHMISIDDTWSSMRLRIEDK